MRLIFPLIVAVLAIISSSTAQVMYTPTSFVYTSGPSGHYSYNPYPYQYRQSLPYGPKGPAYYNQDTTYNSYYKLDSCEYRFILDMVQCHQTTVTQHSQTDSASSSSGFDLPNPNFPYSGYVPHSNTNVHSNYNHRDYNSYNTHNSHNSYNRNVGNPGLSYNYALPPNYYAHDYATSFQPGIGHPFYAPGLDNKWFSNYYARFRAGPFVHRNGVHSRTYFYNGDYRQALQDFQTLKLTRVSTIQSSSQQTTTTYQAGYTGFTPYFGYEVKLLPNHCQVPGYAGLHTCIQFTGATHPYQNVVRQFVYISNSYSQRQDTYNSGTYNYN